MLSTPILVLILSISSAFAAPHFPASVSKRLEPCAPTLQEQVFVAELGWYSDVDCKEYISGECQYAPKGITDGSPGEYGCGSTEMPEKTPFYASVITSDFDNVQILFTRDQTCPPDGPGAVFATLVDNRSCVQMNLAGGTPGLALFLHGGSGINRASNLTTRANPKCTGFNIES
jgi:hypothetical protein